MLARTRPCPRVTQARNIRGSLRIRRAKKRKRKRKRRDAGRRRRKEKVEEENEGGEEESRKGEKRTDARSVRGRICAARVYVTTLHQRRHSPDPYE